jgi:hypothetical protein
MHEFNLESILILTVTILIQGKPKIDLITIDQTKILKPKMMSQVNCSFGPLIFFLGPQEEDQKTKSCFQNGPENMCLTAFVLTNPKRSAFSF